MVTPRPRFWIGLGLAVLALAVGAYAASISGDWSNFARSGAALVIIGGVITAFDWLKAGTSVISMLRHAFSPDRPPSEILGLALMIAGTAIWAFGDLLGLWLG